jgi:hypothetical protein
MNTKRYLCLSICANEYIDLLSSLTLISYRSHSLCCLYVLNAGITFYLVRFEVFSKVTMKNAVVWDIKFHTSQETHYVSATGLGRLLLCKIWGFHDGMKNSVWRVWMTCSSCKSRCFGGAYRHSHQGDNNRRDRNNVAVTSNRSTLRRNTIILSYTTVFVRSVLLLLVTANVSSSPILVMMQAVRSSETSVLTRATRRNFPKDGFLQLC